MKTFEIIINRRLYIMEKKLGKKLLSLMLVVLALAGFVACGRRNTVPENEDTLYIYLQDAGYKTDWLDNVIALFKEQSWVKEKYPNLNIPAPTINDLQDFAESRLASGTRNPYDLMFMSNLPYSYKGSSNQLVDLTEVLYNSVVPGESVLYKEKLNASYVKSMAYNNPSDEYANGRYYTTTWAGGEMSILYNETILNSLGIAVPNTTDELIAACATIRGLKGNTEGKYNKGYSFVASKDAIYWDEILPVWWAQYEGVDNYYNFLNGIDGNRISKNIFKQKGPMKALEIYEAILDYDKGYLDASWPTYEFMTAQTQFLQGNGVFHVNGDWWPSEMAEMESRISENQRQSIKIMPLPVVSSIVDKTPTLNDDETLSKVIDAIDDGQESYAGVSEEDFNKIKEARSVVYSISPNAEALIPAHATAKDLAVDFLRFMATDIACDAYIQGTYGASLPFDYDVENKNPVTFNSLPAFHQERLRYFNSKTNPINVLPYYKSFPLALYGGVWGTSTGNYFSTFSAAGNTKTAQRYYDLTLEAWTDAKWADALRRAGLQ